MEADEIKEHLSRAAAFDDVMLLALRSTPAKVHLQPSRTFPRSLNIDER
jgi:hypothetical protein